LAYPGEFLFEETVSYDSPVFIRDDIDIHNDDCFLRHTHYGSNAIPYTAYQRSKVLRNSSKPVGYEDYSVYKREPYCAGRDRGEMVLRGTAKRRTDTLVSVEYSSFIMDSPDTSDFSCDDIHHGVVEETVGGK